MSVEIPTFYRVGAGAIGAALIAISGYSARDTPIPASAGESEAFDPASGGVIEAMRPLMGSEFVVRVWAAPGREPAAAEAINQVLDGVADLEEQISGWKANSDIARVSGSAGGAAVSVGADLRELLAISERWARRMGGAFDVTAGPLFELWRTGRSQGVLPSDEGVREVLERIGYEKVELHGDAVRLLVPGMKLDFGSIGKGFAADRAAMQLRGAGFSNFIVDAGGDLVVSGRRGNAPWNLGIRHPRSSQLLATAQFTDCAIATSGDYEQYLIVDGKRYGHIIDPRTGWPARGVSSVVAIARTGADADALATGLFVLGPEAGLDLVEKMSSVEALFTLEGGEVRHSKGLSLNAGVLERLE